MKRLLCQVKQYVFPPKPKLGHGKELSAEAWRLAVERLQEMSARFGGASCLPGECNVCGEATAFFCSDPALARESYTCAACRTTSRYRAIARGVLRWFAEERGVRAASLAELARAGTARLPRPVRIYDAQLPFYYATCSYPLPDLLAAVPGVEVHVSRFRPKDALGAAIAGKNFGAGPGQVRASNQNLEQLTFAGGHFDIVITSDVMEHVRLDGLAHAEIGRVLAPGGAYLFTVPHSRGMRDTMHRVVVRDPADPSKDDFVMEREYHGDANDPENAALSFRVYGTEIDATLRGLGFDVDYAFFDKSENGVVNTELFYCRRNA